MRVFWTLIGGIVGMVLIPDPNPDLPSADWGFDSVLYIVTGMLAGLFFDYLAWRKKSRQEQTLAPKDPAITTRPS